MHCSLLISCSAGVALVALVILIKLGQILYLGYRNKHKIQDQLKKLDVMQFSSDKLKTQDKTSSIFDLQALQYYNLNGNRRHLPLLLCKDGSIKIFRVLHFRRGGSMG